MSAQTTYKGHQYVRPVPAYRPRRTRTKTGCLCCRFRRKKCDERKPVCRSCEARDLACSWPEEEQHAQSKRGDGGRQTQVHRGVCIPVGSAASSASVTPAADPPHRDEQPVSPSGSPLTARAPPEEVLQSPCASILLEHFVSKTSHILVARDALRNPWLYSILPMAYANPLVMHAILAISGVHMMHCKPHPEVEQATYAHYGSAVAQLQGRLAAWAGGSQEDTLHLFLAAVLLITYELVDGDLSGNLAHHIRACGEFARHLVASDSDHDLIGLSLELYVYSALVAHLTKPAPDGTCEPSSSSDDLIGLLHRLRNYRTFGSLVGHAYRLYELIPEVARHVFCGRRRASNCQHHSTFQAYSALKARIESWSNETAEPASPSSSTCSTAEYAHGVMIQNSLLMLLHYSWFRHKPTFQQAMDNKIQPLIDDNVLLEELVTDAPVINVSLWPVMVTGSMMRKNEQRLALARKMKAHPTQAPVTSRAVRILNWLWNDTEGESYGLEGLARVASKHGTRLCFT